MRSKLKILLTFCFFTLSGFADILLSTESVEEVIEKEATFPEIVNIILMLICANVCMVALIWLISFLAKRVKENAKIGDKANDLPKEKDINEEEQNN
ncbi:MAG: hypothetical protein GX946_04505 [Oligosphaeraceae bacterium]|nr:hypothetical protein [Oligosphaeraceae bacterium]